jgi:RNA polymerase sigma-70 factor (ECF subfamily)
VHLLEPNSLGDHVDRLYRAARGLCDSREQAEDLVQETLARVLGRRRLLHGEDDAAYLLRALRNTYLTERRSTLRRPRAEHLDDEVSDHAPTPSTVAEAREVCATIATLPVASRQALLAVDVLGLSYREAACALHTCEATVNSRVHRARRQVCRRLDGDPQAARSEAPAGT